MVPYTANKNKIKKYIPLFYLEGLSETDMDLNVDKVEGFDLAYLRFCCKVQGIRNELIAANSCRVVALDDIKEFFPSGTTFEDYWPAKSSLELLPKKTRQTAQQLSSSAAAPSAGNWIQQPPVSSTNQQPAPVSSANQQPPIPFNQRKEKSVSKNNQSATVLKNNPANQIQQQQQQQLIAQQQIVQSAAQKQGNTSSAVSNR